MPSKNVLKKYAALAIQSGVHLKKNQLLVITCDVEQYAFARLCMEEAYKAGAGKVVIDYADDQATRLSLLNESEKSLKDVRAWQKMRTKDFHEQGCAYLHIHSPHPGLFKDVDAGKMGRVTKARRAAMKEFSMYTMASHGQWCILAVANEEWAKKVFPNEKGDVTEKLWKAILKTVYITEKNDPIEVWKKHSEEIKEHCRILNEHSFVKLHFKNSLGTDLTVGLPEGHIWGGGSEKALDNNMEFQPNIPTEEVFTTPHRMDVNGTVVSSRPLSHNGQLIEDFRLTFKKGKVIEYAARKGEETLKSILTADANSNRLGEVALISYDSPISRMGLLFFDTLFDENASCHLALGASYPGQLEGGVDMSEKELMAHGGNCSSMHVDFMFGSKDMSVIGTDREGNEFVIFKNGNFAF